MKQVLAKPVRTANDYITDGQIGFGTYSASPISRTEDSYEIPLANVYTDLYVPCTFSRCLKGPYRVLACLVGPNGP